MPILEANQVRKLYQLGQYTIHALAGVDFSVEEGEFVAIMGPSGSGKSTLLHLLGGLDTPTEGEIVLAGKELSKLNEYHTTLTRRHHVGFVFQFFNLIPTLTAEENIQLPIIIDEKDPKKYADRLEQILGLVGLADRRDHKPEQLSGGQQQRVAIARALITEPAILLADEPTGNLDTKSGIAIMELLQHSCRELNQTVIVVSHDPRAASYADRVIFLRDGALVREYRPEAELSLSKRLEAIMATMQELEQ